MPVATPTLAIADLGTGTTGTATITGSTALTTNTLYYQSVSNRGGAWVSAGSRTGDGTISITGMTTGYYWWRVDSTDGSTSALSNLVYQPILSDDDAFHERCLDGVIARLQELTLDSIDPTNILDQAFIIDDNLSMPCILVGINDQAESNVPGVVQQDDFGLPVYVAIVASKPHKAKDWRPQLLKWREQCVRALHNHQLDGIGLNVTCTVEFQPILQLSGAESQDHIVSAFVVRCVCRETRGLT